MTDAVQATQESSLGSQRWDHCERGALAPLVTQSRHSVAAIEDAEKTCVYREPTKRGVVRATARSSLAIFRSVGAQLGFGDPTPRLVLVQFYLQDTFF